MTLTQIYQTVNGLKPCSEPQFRRYLKAAGVKPIVGIRTKPRLYPDDSAAKVLAELGFIDHPATGNGRILSLRQLKSERRKAQKARGK
jgi:hypothetical protein